MTIKTEQRDGHRVEVRERAGAIEARYSGRPIRVFAENRHDALYRLRSFDVIYKSRSGRAKDYANT